MASTSRRRFTCQRQNSQNIYHLLTDREHGIDRRYPVHKRSEKKSSIEFFKCIPPNMTIFDVEKPPNYIRKFSPDGKYLICFSRDQQSLENYKFLGTANAASLVYKWKTEFIPHDTDTGPGREIRETIFDSLFKLNWSIHLTIFLKPLYREFSLFTDDGKYVIVVTYMPIQEEHIPAYHTLTNGPIPHSDYDLNTYRFYTVGMKDGAIKDSIEYAFDYINLSHNQGVCLHGNRLAFVSLFRQWISIVDLNDGIFVPLYTIGRHFHGSGDCLCASAPEYYEICIVFAMKIDGLKNKMIACMHKQIMQMEDPVPKRELLRKFYLQTNLYLGMQLHKAQFIDGDHLMVRYDIDRQMVQIDATTLTKVFLIYSISKDEVLIVYRDRDCELLRIMTNFYDDFRKTTSWFTGRATSSVSNNIYLQKSQRRLIESLPGGESDAAYRLLPQLPISSQNFSTSPYLDIALFRYDDRSVSAFERPRYCNFGPIRFTDRDSELTKFRLYINKLMTDEFGSVAGANPLNVQELVAYVFHPFEPFAISVQKLTNRYVTNFHIRNEAINVI